MGCPERGGGAMLLRIAFAVLCAVSVSAEDLYQTVLATTGLSEKEALGRSIGAKTNAEAKAALYRLLDASSYWDRRAAVAGLAYFRDEATARLLAEKLADDFMITDAITAVMRKDPARYDSALIDHCRAMRDASRRKSMIGHIASLRTVAASNYIASVVRDVSDTNRADALRELVSAYPADLASVRALVADPALGDTALSILLAKGASNDLPYFLAAFSDGRSSAAKIMTCTAVMRWGDDALKVRIIHRALSASDSALVNGALISVKGFAHPSLYPDIRRLVRTGDSPSMRLLAAEALTDHDTEDAWPVLISSLKEEYSEVRTPLAVDLFVSVISLGISSIFDKLSASASRSEFYARRERINAVLRRKTGMNLSGYTAWREWGVLRGMTVDGVNVIQLLWSADPLLRGKAAAAAVRILGFADRDAFVRSFANKPMDETEYRARLAEALERKGLLRDE